MIDLSIFDSGFKQFISKPEVCEHRWSWMEGKKRYFKWCRVCFVAHSYLMCGSPVPWDHNGKCRKPSGHKGACDHYLWRWTGNGRYLPLDLMDDQSLYLTEIPQYQWEDSWSIRPGLRGDGNSTPKSADKISNKLLGVEWSIWTDAENMGTDVLRCMNAIRENVKKNEGARP